MLTRLRTVARASESIEASCSAGSVTNRSQTVVAMQVPDFSVAVRPQHPCVKH